MMAVDISNQLQLERLEELSIAFICNNLSKTICRGSNEDSLKLSEGVNLPQSLADPILQYLVDSLNLDPMQEEAENEKLVRYIKIFTDSSKCKMRRITLNRAPISDDMVQVLCDLCEAHELLEFDLSHCSDMNGDERDFTPPYNHGVLLPGFIIKFCGKSLKKLILYHSFFGYSLSQIMSFSGKKARALKQDVYLTSEATLNHIPMSLSSENLPALTVLDISQDYTAWFLTIDEENPPPLKVLNFAGHQDVRLNSIIKKILNQYAYGEEEYNPEPGRSLSFVAHSKSERKLAKYPFFDQLQSPEDVVNKFVTNASLKKRLDENLKYENDYSLNPDSNFVFRQMNIFSLKNTLQQLGLYNTFLSKRDFNEIIFNLKNLKFLDVSWPVTTTVFHRFRPQDITLWDILDNLPQLNLLDVSGTSFGENLYTCAEVIGVERFLKMERDRQPLEFLGLFGTNACRLKDMDKLASVITGDNGEEQLIRCLEMYSNRAEVITAVLTKLMALQQESSCKQPNLLLKLVLKCVHHFPTNKNLLFMCISNIYFLVQTNKQNWSVYQKRDTLRAITMILEKNSTKDNLVRNCMIIFFSFDLPGDLLFDFDHIAKVILEIFDKQGEVDEINFISGSLCNAIVSSMEIDVKKQIRKLGYTRIMIKLIKNRLESGNADEVLETAWSALWNVTDETPINSEDFINMDGLSLFRQCYENFKGHHNLHRNMMGLIGNIAEVQHLRRYLAEKETLDLIIHLVTSKESGKEVAYNACRTLSNLLIDDSDILKNAPLQKIRSDMRESILSWDVDVAHNINYRTFDPLLHILRCPKEPVGHLWVMWAIHNLCNREVKYVRQVMADGGTDLIKSIRDNTEDGKTREFAEEIYKKIVSEEGFKETL